MLYATSQPSERNKQITDSSMQNIRQILLLWLRGRGSCFVFVSNFEFHQLSRVPLASCLYNKSESGAGTGTGNGYGYGLTGTGTGTGIFEIVECVWYKNDG